MVLEVGLGGRYDVINIIIKLFVSVIVFISLDYIGIFGDIIEKIVYEKVGIIKENGVVLVYD